MVKEKKATKKKKVVYLNVTDVDGDKHRIDINSIEDILEGEYTVREYLKGSDIPVNEKTYKGTWIQFNYTYVTAYYSRPSNEYEEVFVERPIEEVLHEYWILKKGKIPQKGLRKEESDEISKIAKVESFTDIPKCKFHETGYECLDRMT